MNLYDIKEPCDIKSCSFEELNELAGDCIMCLIPQRINVSLM